MLCTNVEHGGGGIILGGSFSELSGESWMEEVRYRVECEYLLGPH